jgi:hypothetical protein
MATITASGVQLPEIINLAVTKAGLNYSNAHVTMVAPQGTNEYTIRLYNGDIIKAQIVPYGYPRIISIA